ncbi:hypothetical protein FOA52_010875 [Chlamydomonas sp. UWO 241]|nr:hypothetical protein FOA52_010875 [Chlamydomonas sp. UWO 241]
MRASSVTLLLTLALALTCAGSVSAQECDPCVVSCQWPDSASALYFNAESGSTIKDLTRTVACLRAITVPYDLAVQTATSLAKFWEENYVLNNMAKDPLATPHTSNLVHINPYTKGVDIPAKLNAMAAAWPVDQPVPFYDVSLKLVGFFSELRDGHVFPFKFDPVVNSKPGAITYVFPFKYDPVVNRVLKTISLYLIDRNTAKFFGEHSPAIVQAAGGLEPGLLMTSSTGPNGTPMTRLVRSIEGLSWVEWCRSQVTGQLPFGYEVTMKNIGIRVNYLMSTLVTHSGLTPFLGFSNGLGDIVPLADKLFNVEFTDGTTTVWQWVAGNHPTLGGRGGDIEPLTDNLFNVEVTDGTTTAWQWVAGFNASWDNVTSADMTQMVSTNPSSLYRDLKIVGDTLLKRFTRNSTVPARRNLQASGRVAPTSRRAPTCSALAPLAAPRGGKKEAGGRWRRHLLAQADGRGAAAMSNDMAWGSNYIVGNNDDVKGSYAILTSVTDGSKYAVWKLKDFSLSTETYVAHWINLVKMATDAGVTRLMYDVSGNDGGEVPTGYQAAMLLFPELADAAAPRNEYDMIVWPAAEYIIKQGMLPDSETGEVPRAIALVANATHIAQRVAAIKSEPATLAELAEQTSRVLGLWKSR